jgi:uncharacterized protein YecE (DUF72 family)
VATLNNLRNVYIGTSGWSIARSIAPGSRPALSGLQRYAEYFNTVEINSTFHRWPRPSSIERWRDSTPPDFRFAVKIHRSITHEARLVSVEAELDRFCELILGFGSKLGPVLVQLPPSLEFDVASAARCLAHLAQRCSAPIVLEPRHPTWFVADVEALLAGHGVARAAADPPCCVQAALPGADRRVSYFRWHGSPRKYFSAYPPEALATLAAQIVGARRASGSRGDVYCFLDNTALGAAAVNALSLRSQVLIAAASSALPSGGQSMSNPRQRARVTTIAHRHPLAEQCVEQEQHVGGQKHPVLEQQTVDGEAERGRRLTHE